MRRPFFHFFSLENPKLALKIKIWNLIIFTITAANIESEIFHSNEKPISQEILLSTKNTEICMLKLNVMLNARRNFYEKKICFFFIFGARSHVTDAHYPQMDMKRADDTANLVAVYWTELRNARGFHCEE